MMIGTLRKMIRDVWGELALRRGREYPVGRLSLWLPPGHRLDWYQARYANYDRKLPRIAARLAAKYPHMVAMDIGANIGDTAAGMRAEADFPILCVEGSPDFLPILARNAAALGDGIHIVPCFVGERSGHVDTDNIRSGAGTASIASGELTTEASAVSVQVLPLVDIVAGHAAVGPLHLIKSDTDGYDFQIILGARELLAETAAVLFFEYDPLISADGGRVSLDAVSALLAAGFKHFVAYDNFGNFMFSVSASSVAGGVVERFEELNAYLYSSQSRGGGIYYADVCAFKPADADIFLAVLTAERQGVPL